MPKNQFLRLTTVFYAALALIALALNRLRSGEYTPFQLALTRQTAVLSVFAAGLLMAVIWVLVRLDFTFMRCILDKLRRFKPLLIELNQAEKIYISVLAGFSEELLFRGFLQPLWGIVVASLIFGALHAATFGYFILATLMGFYLGGLLHYSGDLLVPISVHALYDVFALNLLARIYRREGWQGPGQAA
ncbi:MAG: CPBP family intramembrane metalloprotease [Deltaproteobacteria bacterium]